MASDTNTKKTEVLRPNIDHLMDLYWGGPERHITGLTLRIIGINAVALVILMLGVLYLGEYKGEPVIMHTYWGIRKNDKTKLITGRTIITSTEPGKELADVREKSKLN